MLRKIYKSIVLFGIITLGNNCIAQENPLIKTFDYFLKLDHMAYKEPKCFYPADSTHNYEPSPDYPHGLLLYSLKSKKNDIVIAFSLIQIRKPNELQKKMFPKLDDINSIEPYIAIEADTIVSKPNKIDPVRLKKINADSGFIYNLKIKSPYLGKYFLCKTVFLHKDDVSNAQIMYFYNQSDQNKVDEIIADTWGILQYEN